jgi:hypothetical protein
MSRAARQLRQPIGWLALGWAVWLVACARTASAEAPSVWELTPYRVQVLVAAPDVPPLAGRFEADLCEDLVGRTEAVLGAAWETSAAPAPAATRQAMLVSLESIATDALPRPALQFDKVVVVAISPNHGGYWVVARELDTRTRLWSAAVTVEAWQPAKLRDAAFRAVLAAFAPLARIETSGAKQVTLRVRASGLPPAVKGATAIPRGTVFRPLVRYNDRDGLLRRVTEIPWTFLTVSQSDAAQVKCDLHSGLRTPLSGRRRGRVESLALAVVPPRKASRLVLEAPGKIKRPLAGYDVSIQPLGGKTDVPIGRTDWQGSLLVEPDVQPLRVLLIRHGGEVLARLPLVPGLAPTLVAPVADDDVRLEAEGFITAFQEELVDLVTRREVLLVRTRARLKAKKPDEARNLFEELRRLPARDDLIRQLARDQARFASSEPGVQRKIDALFADTRKLLDRHLDPDAIDELEGELRR